MAMVHSHSYSLLLYGPPRVDAEVGENGNVARRKRWKNVHHSWREEKMLVRVRYNDRLPSLDNKDRVFTQRARSVSGTRQHHLHPCRPPIHIISLSSACPITTHRGSLKPFPPLPPESYYAGHTPPRTRHSISYLRPVYTIRTYY